MKNEGKSLSKDSRLYIIFSITMVSVMGVASLTPAFPKMAEVLHVNKVQIGWLIGAFTLPGIFLTPIAGIVADRWGRKTVLVPSLLIFAIAGFALFFVHSFHWMIVLRFIQGIGAASLGSINTTLIGDFYKDNQRPEAMGYNAAVISLSTALYPLIGGALAGITWYYPFVLPLIGLPTALLVLLGLKEPDIKRHTDFKTYFKTLGESMLKKNVMALFALSTLTFVILYGALITYLPFLLEEKFQLDAPMIGIMISASSLTSVIVATQIGKLTKKFGGINLLKIAFSIFLVVNLLFPILNHLALILLPVLLFGVGQALNMPSTMNLIAEIAPEDLRGAFMSINGMSLRIGQTIGPFIIGLGYALGGIKGAYFLAAGVAAIGLFLIIAFVEKMKIEK